MKGKLSIHQGRAIYEQEKCQGYQLWQRDGARYLIPLDEKGKPETNPPRGASLIATLRG